MFQTQEPKRTTDPATPRREGMSLYNQSGRKYLNTAERRRFLGALEHQPPAIRLFCLTLMWSGCRISEALALAPRCFDLDAGTMEIETLKRRKLGVVRQVPLPPNLLDALSAFFHLSAMQRDPHQAHHRLWRFSRSTAWRHVKNVMVEAEVSNGSAMPKGLRHTFGVAAFHSVPPHLVQRWLGHASLRTTAIYGDVSGPEERTFAERVWGTW
jgi:integrase